MRPAGLDGAFAVLAREILVKIFSFCRLVDSRDDLGPSSSASRCAGTNSLRATSFQIYAGNNPVFPVAIVNECVDGAYLKWGGSLLAGWALVGVAPRVILYWPFFVRATMLCRR